MASGKLTPQKDYAVQNLHGTIYERFDDATYYYHCHAMPTAEAKLANPVWTIWRENQNTGALTCPVVDGKPTPDFHIATDPTALTYWSTV